MTKVGPRGFLSGGLVPNILALYGVHVANYLFPLLTVPYLARVLGPKEWGLLAFAQAFAGYLQLVVEYGFGLSATRQVAQARDSLKGRAEILAGVLGAKLLLSLLILGLAFAIAPLLRDRFHGHTPLFWAAVFWALVGAYSPLWYFQGLERMRLVALLDVASRAVALVLLFLLVKGPEDAAKVLLLQGGASLGATALALWLAYREVPWVWPRLPLVAQALRTGFSLFLFRGAVSLYTLGNTFILGLLAPPQAVGYYAGAEKISKAFLGLFSPIGQALYPRIGHLVHEGREGVREAARLARGGLYLLGLGGVALGAFVWLSAPLLVRVLLGAGYEEAVPVLRILAFLIPLIALSQVLGIQWMLPQGMDRPFNAIIMGAGLWNLALALLLAPRLQHLGMAMAVVVAEVWVTVAMWVYLRRRGKDPLTLAKGGEA
ncbi:oligosaccharide flippase family protein [Thermus albus]|uniref:oligosaccharide flippase family protein n=1 Tax=Thermus albus TaxID=2908146 RepID=UPI001FAB0AE5